ncbi:ABC transporter substrate-binding protein [Leucobacter sp. HY1910]
MNKISQSRWQRSLALGITGVFALGALAGCAPAADDAAAGSGGNLTIGMVGNTKDEQQPYSAQNSVSGGALYQQIYDGLTRYDSTGEVVYDLAEAMTPNDTLDVWTINLRKGVKLHNGEEFVADDAIESIKYMLDPENAFAPSTQIAFVDPEGLTKVDDYTVEMKLLNPFGPVPDAFADDRIAMRSIEGATAEEPVGTGPFVLDSFTPGQEATLTRFDDYWGEQIEIEHLKFSYLQDQPAITNALRGGQIDIAYSVPFTDVKTLESENGIEILASDSASYQLLEMNMDEAPFDDPRVREALRLVVDRERVVENAFGGYATVANDFIGNNTSCPAPDVPQRKQDIEQAKKLLAEAGVENLELELVTDAAFPGMMEVGQLFAQDAQKAGVTVNVKKLDVATFLNRWLEWPFMIGFTSNPYMVTATNHFLPGGEENATHMDDPEYNELAAKLYATADPDEQCEIITQLQSIEHDRGGDIVPAFSQSITAYRDRVEGLTPDLFGRTAFQLEGVSVQ